MKRLITAQDVYEAKTCGKIYVDKNTLITPQARDVARDNKVEFVEGNLCHDHKQVEEGHEGDCKNHACHDDCHDNHSHLESCHAQLGGACKENICEGDLEKPLSCQEIYDFLKAAIESHIFTEEELMEKFREF